MAFENVTFFEIHLDDATFTATAGGDGAAQSQGANESTDVTESVETDDGKTGLLRVAALVGISLALAVGATLLAKRLFADEFSVDED